MGEFTNHLVHESSPYLLQHAHNPVDWYPWNEQSLKKAVDEDKPILVSIGYAACHWCHVMERESFEDEQVARVMNEHFINIKIDREERPDLDNIYMNAVQTMTGSGGWPLNVFLTPSRKPFYGGTYFPPEPISGRPSWLQVLKGVSGAFKEKRKEIEEQAENLTGHLIESNSFGISDPPATGEGTDAGQLATLFGNIMKSADKTNGGFGRAPKFPQPFAIQYLFRHFYHTRDAEALSQALLSLDKMICGGIYDQLGGGFARYSTDNEWLAPHFEKMLYDNALLVITMSEAYRLTGSSLYADTIRHTMGFIEREMMNEEKAFYSSIDADSEGEEGKYYVWDKEEVQSILQEDAAVFCRFYDITDEGNWERKNILRVKQSVTEFAAEHKLDAGMVEAILRVGRTKLLKARQKRITPALDDKVLLSWNSLMNVACSSAYAALGEEQFRKLAVANMNLLLKAFRDPETGEWFHCYKNGMMRQPAFLDDFAFLIWALIHLQEITGVQDYLNRAVELTEWVIEGFRDDQTGFFYYTHHRQEDVILHSREIYDSATPSGNSIMAWNLYYLSLIFDKRSWKQRAMQLSASMRAVTTKYPASFGMWACCLNDFFYGSNEIAVVGKRYKDVALEIMAQYLPNRVFQSSPADNDLFPLLAGRLINDKTYIYLCRDYTCQKPVETAVELAQLIEMEQRKRAKKAQ